MKGIRKKIAIGLLACLSLFTTSLAIVLGDANAEGTNDVTLSEINLQQEYFIGDKISVPTATLTRNGETKEATGVIVYPNNAKYCISDVTLSQAGQYYIEYSAYFGNVKYTETVSFSVSQPLYQINKSILGNVYYYENYEITEYDQTTSSLSGILIDLPSGAEFVFNQPIDFSNKTQSENFVDFLVLPSEVGEMDFHNLYFKLTDIHDQENYVLISLRASLLSGVKYGESVFVNEVNYGYSFSRAYVKAGAAFQPQIGLENHPSGLIVHKDNSYGYPSVGTSFCGVPSIDSNTALCNAYLKNAFTGLSFDYQTMCIYAKKNLVTDLDNLNYYTEKWTGFTTGEAYLSIYAENYEGSENAKIFISDIDGVDLTENKFVDTVAPDLSVDFDGVDENNLPVGVVGCTYPVFNATALDAIDGALAVTKRVYYNYNSSNRSNCEIIDGKIIPKRSGVYTLVYETTDISGNGVVKKYEFNVIDSAEQLSVTFDEENPTEVFVGQKLRLQQPTVENYIAKYAVDITVSCGGRNVEVLNGEILPVVTGDYKVKYAVTDFVGRTVTIESDIRVSGQVKPVFMQEPVLPKYLISGKTYEIPELVALDYTQNSEGSEVKVKTYVTDKNERYELTGTTYIPEVSNDGETVLIEFVATNSLGDTILPFECSCRIVTNEQGLDIAEYLIPNGMLDVDTEDTYTLITTTENNSGFTLLNALVADGAYIKFSPVLESPNFDKIDIYLTDSVNEAISVKISFVKTATASELCINDSADRYALDASFVNNKVDFKLQYNATSRSIIAEENGDVIVAVKNTLLGETFDGFPSGKVYLRLQFVGVTGESAIKLNNISGQVITNNTKDTGKPLIAILGEYDVQYKLNDTVQLLPAVVGDVIDPEVSFTLSVKGPDNQFIKDVNGLELNNVEVKQYSIKLSSYGNYTVLYYAKDSAGKYIQLKKPLMVLDEVAPVITVSGTIKDTMKVGESLTIPNATATDNVDGTVNVYVYVKDPNGKIKRATNTWEMTQKGNYVVQYVAIDEYGNMSVNSYEIKVK